VAAGSGGDRPALFASPHVRQAELEGRIVLIDLASGEYLLLNRAAAEMWRFAVALGPARSADPPPHDPAQDAGAFDAAYGRFTDACLDRGILCERRPVELRGAKRRLVPTRAPSLLAWLWLVRCARCLRRKGFRSVWELAIEQAPEIQAAADPERLEQARIAFRRAELFHLPGDAPNDCLPRSLAIFAFFRAMGLPVEHHIGFEPDLGSAHAWVECEGRIVLDGDRRGQLARFRPVCA
jgi:hypothetical protein